MSSTTIEILVYLISTLIHNNILNILLYFLNLSIQVLILKKKNLCNLIPKKHITFIFHFVAKNGQHNDKL